MKNVLGRWTGSSRGTAVAVLLTTLILLLLAIWSLRHIHLENDISNWLPADDPQAKTLKWYHHHFLQEDRVLVSWEGSSLSDPRVVRFQERLEGTTDDQGVRHGGLKQVRAVLTPQAMIARMDVNREEAVRRLEGVLIGRGPKPPVAVLITLSNTAGMHKSSTLRAIRQAADDVGIEPDKLHLGGQMVAGAALNRGVLDAAWNPNALWYQLPKRSVLLLTGVVGAAVVFIMLRNLWLAAQVLIIALSTTLLTVALVPVTGGSMNMVLVVMPPLLLVLTISGAIHVANYWKYAAQHNRRTAISEALHMARQPCALASITTAIGLLSLMTSPLTPVRDFGLYSAIGCLIGLAMVLLVFPALLQLWPPKRYSMRRKSAVVRNSSCRVEGQTQVCTVRSVSSHSPHSAVESTGWEQAGYWLSQHRWAVTIATIAVCVAGGQGLRWFHTETKNIHNFPQDSQIVRDYRFLEEEVAGVVPVQLIVRFQKSRDSASTGADFLEHMALVRALEDKLREYPDISGTLSLADFFPVVQPLPPTASVVERLMDRRRANEMRKRIRQADPTRLKAFLTVAPTASDLNVTGDHRLNQPGDELWRITAQVAILSDLDYSDLVNDLHHVAQSVLAKHPGTGHVVTGVVPLFLETQRAVLDSLIRSFALAFAVIAVVMMIVLKHPLAGLLAMLPNLQPIVVVFGLISWFGLSVNIGTMITASVALGIAVDGTLHLMTWFRTGVAGDLPRQEAVAQALAHCGPAMWQTSLAVGAGLLMLYPANLLLISRFGWLMAALIAAALLADIVFLPALLAGRLGCLIQKTVAPLASLATPQESVDPQLADERRTDQSDSIHCKCGFTSEVQSL